MSTRKYAAPSLPDRDSRPLGQQSLYADVLQGGRLRSRPGGRYQLRRRLGRGVKVCRRRGTAGGWVGFAMVAGGVVALGGDSLAKGFSLPRVGMLLVVCGGIVAAYAKLKARTEANSETYRLGYDLGYEDGYQEARRLSRPVVVDLDSRRLEQTST